jgi:hypothetical protein
LKAGAIVAFILATMLAGCTAPESAFDPRWPNCGCPHDGYGPDRVELDVRVLTAYANAHSDCSRELSPSVSDLCHELYLEIRNPANQQINISPSAPGADQIEWAAFYARSDKSYPEDYNYQLLRQSTKRAERYFSVEATSREDWPAHVPGHGQVRIPLGFLTDGPRQSEENSWIPPVLRVHFDSPAAYGAASVSSYCTNRPTYSLETAHCGADNDSALTLGAWH